MGRDQRICALSIDSKSTAPILRAIARLVSRLTSRASRDAGAEGAARPRSTARVRQSKRRDIRDFGQFHFWDAAFSSMQGFQTANDYSCGKIRGVGPKAVTGAKKRTGKSPCRSSVVRRRNLGWASVSSECPNLSVIVGAFPMFGEVEPFPFGIVRWTQTKGEFERIEEHSRDAA